MYKKMTIFLTGATGLLGSYLLRIFLQNGHKVYCLVRRRNSENLRERVIETLKFWGNRFSTKNLIVLEGDITKDRLGFDKQSYLKLKDEIEEIFHCAAITNLNRPLEQIREVNVEGTRNTLELANEFQKNGKLLKTNHISTAYIYGNYVGRFKENDLDKGQEFHNTYEQSKFEAERIVEFYRKKGLWIDIYRPPIIIGHSKSGKILKFRNIYQLLYLCSLGIFNSLPVLNSYTRIVPVDSVSEAIYKISVNKKEKNKNYHPFPDKHTLIESIINLGCRLMEFKSPRIVSMKDFDIAKLTPAQMMILENSIFSVNFKADLDSSFTNDILSRLNFSFPRIDNKLLTVAIKYFINKSS